MLKTTYIRRITCLANRSFEAAIDCLCILVSAPAVPTTLGTLIKSGNLSDLSKTLCLAIAVDNSTLTQDSTLTVICKIVIELNKLEQINRGHLEEIYGSLPKFVSHRLKKDGPERLLKCKRFCLNKVNDSNDNVITLRGKYFLQVDDSEGEKSYIEIIEGDTWCDFGDDELFVDTPSGADTGSLRSRIPYDTVVATSLSPTHKALKIRLRTVPEEFERMLEQPVTAKNMAVCFEISDGGDVSKMEKASEKVSRRSAESSESPLAPRYSVVSSKALFVAKERGDKLTPNFSEEQEEEVAVPAAKAASSAQPAAVADRDSYLDTQEFIPSWVDEEVKRVVSGPSTRLRKGGGAKAPKAATEEEAVPRTTRQAAARELPQVAINRPAGPHYGDNEEEFSDESREAPPAAKTKTKPKAPTKTIKAAVVSAGIAARGGDEGETLTRPALEEFEVPPIASAKRSPPRNAFVKVSNSAAPPIAKQAAEDFDDYDFDALDFNDMALPPPETAQAVRKTASEGKPSSQKANLKSQIKSRADLDSEEPDERSMSGFKAQPLARKAKMRVPVEAVAPPPPATKEQVLQSGYAITADAPDPYEVDIDEGPDPEPPNSPEMMPLAVEALGGSPEHSRPAPKPVPAKRASRSAKPPAKHAARPKPAARHTAAKATVKASAKTSVKSSVRRFEEEEDDDDDQEEEAAEHPRSPPPLPRHRLPAVPSPGSNSAGSSDDDVSSGYGLLLDLSTVRTSKETSPDSAEFEGYNSDRPFSMHGVPRAIDNDSDEEEDDDGAVLWAVIMEQLEERQRQKVAKRTRKCMTAAASAASSQVSSFISEWALLSAPSDAAGGRQDSDVAALKEATARCMHDMDVDIVALQTAHSVLERQCADAIAIAQRLSKESQAAAGMVRDEEKALKSHLLLRKRKHTEDFADRLAAIKDQRSVVGRDKLAAIQEMLLKR